MPTNDHDPATAGIHAFTALRHYTPLFPDDHVPYRAMSHVMNPAEDHDAWRAVSGVFQEELNQRLRQIDDFIRELGITGERGMIQAARYALLACISALDDPPSVAAVSEWRKKSMAAVRGVGLPLAE